MNKHYWFYVAIFVLVFCNILILYKMNKSEKVASDSISYLSQYVQKYQILKDNLVNNIAWCHSQIDNMSVFDKNLKESKLSDIVSKSTKYIIFVRVLEGYCNSCIDYSLKLCRNLKPNDDIPMVFLLGYSNNHIFSKNVEDYKLGDREVYNCINFDLPIDKCGYPYLMVVNRDLQIEYCYFPTKGYESSDIENLNMIIDCYAKKYN